MPRATRSDLNPRLRDTALRLRLEGYSLRQIAAQMGISSSRVHQLLSDLERPHLVTVALTEAELEAVQARGGRRWLRKLIAHALKPPQNSAPTDGDKREISL